MRPAASPESVGFDSERLKRLDAYMAQVVADGRVAGMTTLLARHGKGHRILGYHHWTLVDNFEWAWGYAMKFGLIELDPATQARQARPSAAFYADIIKENGLTADMLRKYAPDSLHDIFTTST